VPVWLSALSNTANNQDNFLSTDFGLKEFNFYSKHEKKPKPIKGLEGMYSLKRLSETV
jgi:hypothetical protein